MALSAENQQPPVVVVMGVSGVGKTTVARLLADRLDLPYAEADDFHPAANIAKMSAGIPLDDRDRLPWLQALGGWLGERAAAGSGGVVTCSALKRRYRDVLRAACPDAFFLHLSGSHDLVGDRMAHRTGHFMPTSLLDSQYAALEPLQADENGTVLDVGADPDTLVGRAAAALAQRNG
ncbi:gluconokinase [Kitasatospora cineracea]|uniref:gluconokinase n=1 Tax=Kitasatospora TaxID=2063 RepID=UPI00228505B2|nr:gluconokinase [Kitasatospora sp. YST-16]WAL70915.1 gluconokinase [Kitasatospora sp. YST-16]WNW36952.1 gluconokinase [Streptomyces sp. Li-HN-5-13]